MGVPRGAHDSLECAEPDAAHDRVGEERSMIIVWPEQCRYL